ncbi:MAG: hypothetical protein ACON4M_07405 [Crocinitomicaceae bacterium]
MNKAIIDLGTNTFNLLIAKVDHNQLSIIHSEKSGASIGMGGINNNILTEKAISRAVNSLTHFKKVCNEYNVNEIKAFGTSAIRDAKNNKEFCSIVKNKIGLDIIIIDGQKEAELIFDGVSKTISNDEFIIMDIGGGSTEFIFVKDNSIKEAKSFNIGISRIYQYFSKLSDPLTTSDVIKIEDWLERNTNSYFTSKYAHTLVGASGTFETFYELINNVSFPTNTSKSIQLDINQINKILENLIFSSKEERFQNEYLIPIRKLMAPIAAVKTRWVLKQMKIKKIYVSPYSLKEGALFSL